MIRRLLAFLDRHLTEAGLLPRRKPDGLDLRLAHSGRPVAVDALTRWRETRSIDGVWPCCQCCPLECCVIHRDACDVHQTGPVTA